MAEEELSVGEVQVEEQKEVIDDINKAIRSVIQKSQSNNGKQRGNWEAEGVVWPLPLLQGS